MLDITHLFQFSRLFRRQWRKQPAVAIASLIINADKRRTVLIVQNADVAPATGRRVFALLEKRENQHMSFLISPQTHLRMANKKP